MSFLAPLWLLLGAAAAVPLLVHLLRRRTGARAEFPAARYLLRAEREHSRSLRLRNLLLMLLRVAVILLVATAAARPAGRFGVAPGAGHAPTALAIVIDNSLSTSVVEGQGPVLDRLRADARRLVAEASADDRVFIIDVLGRVGGGSATAAASWLEDVTPITSAGDLPAAVQRAVTVAAGAGELAPLVVVLTDGQRSAWQKPVEVPAEIPVVLLSPGTPAPRNRAVTEARPRSFRWTPQGSLDVRIHASDSTAFRVSVTPDRGTASVVARARAAPGERVTLPVGLADTGWVAGAVAIDGDELPGDDVRYFAAWLGKAPGVRVLPGAGPFARNAVDVLRVNGTLRSGNDVLVAAAHEGGAGAVPSLIVPPASPTEIGTANAVLARRGIPWRFGAPRGGGALRGDTLLAGTIVRQAYALEATSSRAGDTLARVDGSPWAVGGVARGVRYVVIASPLTPEATALPVSAAFLPWLAQLVADRLAGAEGEVVAAAPGERLRRPPRADSLRSPDGPVLALAGETMLAPRTPGVHFLSGRGATVGALVVNVEETESVLDRLPHDALAAQVPGGRVTAMSLGRVAPATLFAAGGDRSLVPFLLAAALLALVVEAAITVVRSRGVA